MVMAVGVTLKKQDPNQQSCRPRTVVKTKNFKWWIMPWTWNHCVNNSVD